MARWGDWWLCISDHVVSAEVSAPPQEVRLFYCDLRNTTRLHPLVISVHTTGYEQTDYSYTHAYTQFYRVRDRIPVGPFSLRIAYAAQVHVPVSGDVLTEARQFPRVRLHGRVSFESVGGGTRLVERLRIEAPRPLAALTVSRAVQAHSEMLAGIRRCFD